MSLVFFSVQIGMSYFDAKNASVVLLYALDKGICAIKYHFSTVL